ncbi:MAG: transketolase family protein [Thermodesulfovibrionia bacterium]
MGKIQTTEQITEKRPKATRQAYGEVLVELGRIMPEIVVLDADLSASTKTNMFAKEFPERFFNMGVAEQDMIATAAGLALTGKIPFASTFAVFETGRAWDQIRQTVCYSNTNVKLVASHGGITVGPDGASHQALEDIALMRALPNMTVIVPADANETKAVIRAIVRYKGPVYVRLGRANVPFVMPDDYEFHIGKAHVFHIGRDANIIACGIMVDMAKRASEILLEEGIDTGVINMSTIKPIDEGVLLHTACNSRLIVTAEEHSIIGGLGGAVCEFLSERCPIMIKRIGIQDVFGCSGPAQELLRFHGLTVENIVETVRGSLKG